MSFLDRAHQGGFTLVEMLLSVTIITMLVGIGLPVYFSFNNRNSLELNTESVVSLIQRAENYARAMNGDSAWSVEFQAGTVTLFKGTNFAGRSTGFDETVSVNQTLSGLTEVQFAKFSGLPNTTGSVTLTSGNDTKTITLNAKGMVDY